MKKSEANHIINLIIDECWSRRFSCKGCPFISDRYGNCQFSGGLPRNWYHRREIKRGGERNDKPD